LESVGLLRAIRPYPTRPMKDRRRPSARHAERTERSGGLVPPVVTRTRPRQRRGIQIPDERVSLGPTPVKPPTGLSRPDGLAAKASESRRIILSLVVGI
jgi:hypothetical protein